VAEQNNPTKRYFLFLFLFFAFPSLRVPRPCIPYRPPSPSSLLPFPSLILLPLLPPSSPFLLLPFSLSFASLVFLLLLPVSFICREFRVYIVERRGRGNREKGEG